MNTVYLKKDNEWLTFEHPQKIITTQNINEVCEALENVEALVNDKNWHAVGFVSYEAARAFDFALQTFDLNNFPLIWFGFYENPTSLKSLTGLKSQTFPTFKTNQTSKTYNNAIGKIKDYIANGKTYQVNYTMRLVSDFVPDSFSLFLHLAQTQNKYAAFIETDDFAICSASPELFFELNGETIFSKPMKGTIKRGRTTKEDLVNSNWLRASEKNRAENVMIVDMLRNDLGKIAQSGSVHVPELFAIEKYPTLFQMTSTVGAKTNASVTKIFSALFPCASITGAPKVSTMKIIKELETSPRKIYTGSIGYIFPNRQARFNVAIRTALIDKKNKTAEYGVGGGIVWDSEDKDEFEEALLKSKVLTNPPQPEFSLFETLLWTKDEGYFLLDKHIARLKDSASYFDFEFSEEEVEKMLSEVSVTLSDSEGSLPKQTETLRSQQSLPQSDTKRVKIILDKNGNLTSEVKDFDLQEKVFKVCLANQLVNSNDVFLFHKTTHREVYEKSMQTGFDDVLLFNEKDECTEFTIGNLVVEQNGEFFTPPITCGLLAGTFREHLLETGKIKERIIYKHELNQFEKIYLINSVRKWVEVALTVPQVG
ncbi:MAG: aminodeoxychorismate synthase component I [Anaerolineales bacterium]|nr:aminodeoxychorismate synthase component I [Anaerolineales bacterium]